MASDNGAAPLSPFFVRQAATRLLPYHPFMLGFSDLKLVLKIDYICNTI